MFLINYIKRKFILFTSCLLDNKKLFLNEGEQDFIKYNKTAWEKKEHSEDGIILILASALIGGPNYLFRTATIAKRLEEMFNYTPMVVINKEKCHAKKDTILYTSYNIKNYIFTKIFYKSIFRYIKSYFIALFLFRQTIKNNNLSQLRYKNVLIGDCIYDDIIKAYKGQMLNNKPRITVDKIISDDFKFFFTCIDYFLTYQEILKRHNVKYVITTHTQFSEYSLFARLAYKRGVSVFETTDISLTYSDAKKKNIIYPSYHATLREHIRNAIKQTTEKEKLALESMRELEQRHKGFVDQYDVRLAYHNKKLYTKDMLKDKLNISNKNKFVIILCHIFSDASLSGGDGMAYDDYFEWLHSTLIEVSKIKNINWLVKPHPASKQYKEDGIVKKEVENHGFDNIFIVPDDFSTASIINTVDVIVTARGTGGLEYSCYGIPTVMAGKSFYSNFGFTIDSSNHNEYINNLKNIENVNKLNKEQMDNAKLVYYYFNRFSTLENDKILTYSLLNKIRGTNGEQRDISEAYKILKHNLETHGYNKWAHYKLIEDFVTNGR